MYNIYKVFAIKQNYVKKLVNKPNIAYYLTFQISAFSMLLNCELLEKGEPMMITLIANLLQQRATDIHS